MLCLLYLLSSHILLALAVGLSRIPGMLGGVFAFIMSKVVFAVLGRSVCCAKCECPYALLHLSTVI